MHTVLTDFNAVGHDEEVSGEFGSEGGGGGTRSGSKGGGGGREVAEAGEQCLQPLPQ